MSPSAAPFTDELFEQYEVVTGSGRCQAILTGFLLGGDLAELVVVNIDENDDRRLRIYACGFVPQPLRGQGTEFVMRLAKDYGDGVWMLMVDAILRPDVVFVDVANIGGRDRLVTYVPGRLNWFDPDTATEQELVAVTSDFNPPSRGLIPHVDVTRDINDDDLDDLVVPDVDGFWVFIQLPDGAFADPLKIGRPSETGRVYGADGYRYEPWAQGRRIHEMDYNRDGRRDLVFWNEDHFEVHCQDEHGLFDPSAETFTTEATFDSDELASLAVPLEARDRRRDQALTRDLSGRVLHSLTDMNGDGVADLVVFSLEAGRSEDQVWSLMNMHFAYEVHFGTPAPDGGIAFAPDVSTAIESRGIPFAMEQYDFDHDGEIDVMFTTIHVGIFKAIGMLIDSFFTQSVSMDLEFYRMEGGIYPDQPSATREIRADVPPVEAGGPGSFFPAVLIGDVNGDSRPDLLIGRSRKELRVFLGVEGPELFARQHQVVAVAMPRDEEYSWLVDLNMDGKQDLLMHHPSATEPHRVTMLIAR